jgi:hypothetical protein
VAHDAQDPGRFQRESTSHADSTFLTLRNN